MALVKVLDKYDMQREFKAMGRDYFSLDAYQELINLFEETDCGKNTDLDVIAICCEFTEDTAENIYQEYQNLDDIAECKDEETDEIDYYELLDALSMHTIATELSNGNILYQNF